MMHARRSLPQAILAAFVLAAGASAADVQVTQLDWIGDDGLVAFPASRIVNLEFTFDAADPQDQLLLFEGGFINVTTPDGQWLVQNLYQSYDDPFVLDAVSPSVLAGLEQENGIPVPELELGLTITPFPLDVPEPAPFEFVPVTPAPYHVGGRELGGSGLSSLPFTLGPWIGVDPFLPPLPDQIVFTDFFTGIRPVNEELNGCAPASAARSIQYMGDRNGFATDPIQDIYDDLKGDMGTVVGPGGGTSDPGFLAGKDQYVDRESLPIDTEQVFGWTMASVCAAADAIDMDGDVEVLIGWDGGGGHAAMITSIVKWPDGSATITYVDDPTQGDGMAENEEHVIHVRPDGTFEGGRVDGFQIETFDRCPTDLDGDGTVGFSDLLALLAAYGDCPGPGSCEADLDGDGNVGFSDVLVLLAEWGPCAP